MRWMVVAVLLAISAPALAQDGSGDLRGPSTLRVRPKCGTDRTKSNWALLLAGGAWTAAIGGNSSLAGTATPVGNSGKIWNLAFDGVSKASFDLALTTQASILCGTPVTAAPSQVTQFDLKLNKRGTRAKLRLFANAAGSTAQGDGRGSLKMLLRGSWQAAS